MLEKTMRCRVGLEIIAFLAEKKLYLPVQG